MAVSCECDDEPACSSAMESVSWFYYFIVAVK
jgi:hypothetical protein